MAEPTGKKRIPLWGQRVIAAVALVILVGGGLILSNNSDRNKTLPMDWNPSTRAGMWEEFMPGCREVIDEGWTSLKKTPVTVEKVCDCIFDRFVEKWTPAEYRAMGQDEMTLQLDDMTGVCLKQVD